MFVDEKKLGEPIVAPVRDRVAAVMLAAADYIEAHGLKQGSFGEPGGPVCYWGAISLITIKGQHTFDTGEGRQIAIEAAKRMGFIPEDYRGGATNDDSRTLYAATQWNNDTERTTKADVVARLRASA